MSQERIFLGHLSRASSGSRQAANCPLGQLVVKMYSNNIIHGEMQLVENVGQAAVSEKQQSLPETL